MGLANKDITGLLNLSIHTVKRHIEQVLTKLGVNTRAVVVAQIKTPGGS